MSVNNKSDSYDFSSLVYNIEGIPEDQNCIEKFADLMTLSHIFMNESDLPEGVSADKVLRYLIYMFDPGTPIRAVFVGNIERRKQWVLNKINIQLEDGVESGYSEMCAMNKTWIANRFIAFTHFFRSADEAIIATAEIRMAMYQKMILTAKIDKATDEGHFVTNLGKWRDAMDLAVQRIMDGEQSKRLQEELVYSIKTNSLGITNEEFAKTWLESGTLYEEVTP